MSIDTAVSPGPAPDFGEQTGGAPSRRQPERNRWFDSLYEQNSQWLLGFALRLTGHDRQRAQDIAQETLIRVWRFAPDPRPDDTTSLRPWLAPIARRVSINEYRKTMTRPPERHLDDNSDVTISADDTTQVLRLMTITQGLRGLSPMHRQVLIEIYFHGRTVAETATLLHIAIGTVKSRLHTALRTMRQTLLQLGDAGLITG